MRGWEPKAETDGKKVSSAALSGPKRHGIPRAKWERRFCDVIKRAAEVGDDIAAAELESWPEFDEQPGGNEDWLTEQPEIAAQENLTYWIDNDP